MSPKKKAIELVEKFNFICHIDSDGFTDYYETKHNRKQCALIAVDEMIVQNGELYLNSLGEKTIQFYILKNNFLFEVKKEIKLL